MSHCSAMVSEGGRERAGEEATEGGFVNVVIRGGTGGTP